MSRAGFVYRYLLNKSFLRTYTPIAQRNLSTKDVDTVKTQPNDILLNQLRNAVTANNILELVSDHHKIMNNKHLIQALKSLFVLKKSGLSDISTNDLINDDNFKKLCLRLKSQARSIDLKETIEALKVVSYVGIPSHSTITQILLQLIRQNVNHLSLQQIIFLEYILKQLKSTPLSDALLIAFPIVFEINLALKLDKGNLNHLTDVLQYVSRKHISEENLNLITNSIMTHRTFDARTAVRILWSLCDLTPHPDLQPLLQKAMKTVTRHSNIINFQDLETTLAKVSYRTNYHQPYFYNEGFCSAVADVVINEDLGFQQALYIQQKFNKIRHFHKGLMDYICQFCQSDENIISTTSQENLSILVAALTNSQYRPNINWENLQSKIENNHNLFSSNYQFDWVKFATRLAILDIYLPKVLEKTFTENNIEKLSEFGNHDDCRHFLILCEAISTLQKQYKCYLPSSEKIQSILTHFQSINVQEYPLQEALEKAFGGKQYILSKCVTKFGTDINHAIIMRKGGFPVSFSNLDNQSQICLSDLECPTDSKIIAILSLGPTSYCQNAYSLRGINTLVVKILEQSNYSVVTIINDKWLQLADYEKIPYLMRLIREKSDYLDEHHAEM